MNMVNQNVKNELVALIESYADKVATFAISYEGLGTAEVQRKEMRKAQTRIMELVGKL